VWDKARCGKSGASVVDEDEVEERGWLVTVAERFGKYDVGFASIGQLSWGETSGEVIEDA
jgi:hypothetical protein